MSASDLKRELSKYASDSDAIFLQRFFKSGPGEYGEGDVFIGIRVPDNRKVCRAYDSMSIDQIEPLLESDIHEHRLAGLIIMSNQAKSKKCTESQKKDLYELYLRRADRINNWDLVDVSCRDVVGGWLKSKPRDPLYDLAKSDNIWERRIAIVSTWEFIRAYDFADTLYISEMLMNDKHDLIHKACGWMLREVGKKDVEVLINFLEKNAGSMPRTMLRYSLERLTKEQKIRYMNAK